MRTPSFFNYLMLVTQLGLTVAISILAGLFVGMFFDKRLQTSPLFTIIFLLFGVVGGFIGAYKLIMQQERKSEGSQSSSEQDKH